MNKILLKLTAVMFLGVNLHALDINKAVEISLLNNNNLKKQQYIYDEAKENITLTKSSFNPKFDLDYQYSANKEDIGQGKDYSSANAVISYNLFNGYKDSYDLKSAKELSETSLYNLEAVKHDLIYRTKFYYISYLKSLKNIDTKMNAFKLLEQQYNDSQNKFDQGLLAKNDLLQVNAQMLQSKQNLALSIANSKIARYELKNILGGSLENSEKVEDLKKEKIELENYTESELDNRSEIKAMKKSIDSILSQKSANDSAFMPKADLKLAYTKYGSSAFLDVKDSSVDNQHSAIINVKWNLFNGGKDKSQNIIYKKRLQQTKEDLEKLKLDIKLQYEKAIEEFTVSKLNYETAILSLKQSKENYKIVNNRFQEGLSSSTDLINANYLLTQAKQSFDNAYYDRFLAKSTLERIFEK